VSRVILPFFLFCTLLFTGCAPITQNQMAAKGSTPLTAKQIFDMVSGNSLHLESVDFNANIYLQPDGSISASGESLTADDTDKGGWDINGANQLCLKFKVWYYGEMKCYSVYPDVGKNAYAFFNDKGVLAYNAKVSSGDSSHLYKSPEPTKKKTFLRESLASSQTSAQASSTNSSRPEAEPAPKATYLRKSLTSSQPAALHQQASSPSEPTVIASPGASDDEIEHTVKSMAKNCPGCNLEKSDLRQADLVGANLQGANLKGADLSRANLRRANLEAANLHGASLLSANLPGVNLKKADLTNADFTGANLIQADFTGAKTENMILTNAHTEGAKGLK